jgi:hypothetical protein
MMHLLVLLAAISTQSPTSVCADAFNTLYAQSTESANHARYLQAAALREASAHIFESCRSKHEAPTYGLYPLDGVNAFIVAAMFWHLAGINTEAERTLTLARNALSNVTANYPASRKDANYNVLLQHESNLLNQEEKGQWPVWSDR